MPIYRVEIVCQGQIMSVGLSVVSLREEWVMAISISIQAQGLDAARHNTIGVQAGTKNPKQVFAGNLNLTEDPIAQRRKQAQEQALKLVRNAWENDQSVQREVKSRKENYLAYEAAMKEAQAELSDNQDDAKVLQKLYGVSDDSTEQKDLELLKKRQDYRNHVGEPLTEEEEAKLAEIDKKPLTEYQERALELNGRSAIYKKAIQDSQNAMRAETGNIKRILLEKLKSDPMVKAQDAADNIRAAANDEIVGMLVSEATENIDKELEEEKEKADKKAEEQKKKDEQLEQIELKRAVAEAMTQKTEEAIKKAKEKAKEQEAPELDMAELLDVTSQKLPSKDVQQGLSDIKSSMKVLEADLKGIKVDEEV